MKKKNKRKQQKAQLKTEKAGINFVFLVRQYLNTHAALIFWSILALFIIPVSLVKIYDSDIWWHMQLGRSLLENMGVPDFTDFYFTPVNSNFSDLRFTWLGDILLFIVHWLGQDVGLQVMRLAIVFLACYFLMSIARHRYTGWHLLALMFFVLATYQKQLMRNSIFGLLFTMLLFWLWWQTRYGRRENLVFAFPFLIGTWGIIHGSYLLGFAVMFLIFTGDWIDTLRGINRWKKSLFVKMFVVLVISFASIYAWNPLTQKFISWDRFKSAFSMNQSEDVQGTPGNPEKKMLPAKSQEDSTGRGIDNDFNCRNRLIAGIGFSQMTGTLESIKVWLNNTVFPQKNALVKSADFVSPFDKLDRLYVVLSLLCGAMGFFFLFLFSRPIRFSHLLPFLAIMVVGTGYLRMVGYIPMVVLSCTFIASQNKEFTLHFNDKLPKLLCPLLLAAMYVNLASGFKVPIGTELHAFGLGKMPLFGDKIADRILEEYKEKKTFTTITNGGFLLYKWYPEKKVYIDGFFAPHPYHVFKEYMDIVNEKVSPGTLYHRRGIEVAIVEQSNPQLNWVFLQHGKWTVRYIDSGMIAYVFEKKFGQISTPELLISQEEIFKLPEISRSLFANYLFQIQDALIKQGKLKDVHDFRNRNGSILKQLKHYVAFSDREKIETLLSLLTEFYGENNVRAIQNEVRHFQAMAENDNKKALKYGLSLLEQYPNRFPVVFNLASIYETMNRTKKRQRFMDKLWEAKVADETFWEKNKGKVARLCLKVYSAEKNANRFLSAYNYLSKAFLADPSFLSKEKLYDEGMKLVRTWTEKGMAARAYQILKRMEKDFPNSANLLNEIAWHILSHPDEVFEGPEVAREYAHKAVKLMEEREDPLLDLSYDTLAEAYYQLKQYDLMAIYEYNAIQSAPEERKTQYKHRLENTNPEKE